MNVFENDHEALQIGALTIENGFDEVIICGDVAISHDEAGKQKAQALYDFAQALLVAMDKSPQPQPKAQEALKITNPFGED